MEKGFNKNPIYSLILLSWLKKSEKIYALPKTIACMNNHKCLGLLNPFKNGQIISPCTQKQAIFLNKCEFLFQR